MATPKIIPYTVKLRSVVPEKTFSKPPVVYTNDLRSAEFQFKIADMDASELLTATAKTMLYMRDGSFFQNPSTDVSREGNVFSYLLKENEGNHAGIAKIQLVVYFNEGLANEQNFPTQLYEFEIINGLETKVAQEVMIYDWTTLTRDAQDYIDQFVSDEVLRDAQFDNAQFDRNITFVATQEQRAIDFTAAQDSRTATFNASEVSRTQTFTASETAREQEFDLAEAGRAAGYTADHNRAETDHIIAGMDHVTAVDDNNTAQADHTTALDDHAVVQGYDGRLTTVEGHAMDTANPHAVTKIQVGLGNVDNTSDANKPVSTAQQTALNAKANKVQEGWITPTLLNGWTEVPGFPVGYLKDDFGFVHLKGQVSGGALGGAAFLLAVGYRPSSGTYRVVSATAGTFSDISKVGISTYGNVSPTVKNTNVFLDGITFKSGN